MPDFGKNRFYKWPLAARVRQGDSGTDPGE